MFYKLLFLVLLACQPDAAFVAGQTVVGPSGELTASNMDVAPDGFNRPVIAVNGQHPSPLIRANKGDNFDLTVVNSLEDPTMLRQTSIHWHGMFQRTTAWADGADGVTQCPISQNGESFTYRFNAGNEAGTYWYHSHFGTQYCDGLRGPLVIYDQDDPHQDRYDVDDETTIITLADWYHQQAPSITGAALSDATLINGKGRAPGGPATPIEIVNVTQGTRYRFRLTDGQPTEPHTVQEIQIFAGQRYSFVLEANQEPSNYWIRAIPNVGGGTLPNVSGGGINSAILRYAYAPAVDPTTSAPANPIALQESNLRSLIDPAAPGGSGPAQENVLFNLGFAGGRFTMNGASWVSPDSPVLVQIMNGVPAADVVPEASLRTLQRNAVVEVSIPGLAIAGPHPFHLHGHAFSVVRSAGSSTYNYENPVKRDVVSTGGPNDNVTIRFTTDNPGPWFFHCGLAMVFLEAPEDIPYTVNPPVEWDQLCPKYDSLPASATSIQTVPTRPPFS
ncbi:laccase 10 [Coprinopsis sp. MPI-PUGE-AT-0042]|nr:laccase 10 [Coprinopsis sp. MPI-PUGE-AT-0042]